MNPIYKYTLRVGSLTATATEVHPVWKDDLAIEWAQESGQHFMRSSLSGNIVLQRDDYDLVMAQTFGTVYYLQISISTNNGTSWSVYWTGKFTLTDCTVNVDDKRMTVKVQVVDDYSDILSGWEKEYDLIKLLPEIQKIGITKRPMIQIYSEGASYINCFIGQVYFEEDVNSPTAEDIQEYLTDECHFAILDNYVEINFENPPAGFGAPFTGMLTNGAYLTNTIGTYRLKYYEVSRAVQQFTVYENGLQVVPSDSDTVLWQYSQENAVSGYKPLPITMEFDPVGGTDTLTADRTTRFVYGRVVCNTPSRTGYETWPIRSDDLVPYNRNYLYCRPFNGTYGAYSDIFTFAYTGKSNDPTEWGMDDNGQYFTAPSYQGCYPIGRTNWVNTSDWYQPGWAAEAIDADFSCQYTLNNAYPIWSCIKVLLAQIAPDITFEATTAYSEFLFRQVGGVYSDPVGERDCRLYITPKSNITAGEYDTPAQTAPVTLKALLDMMAKTFCLYWFVESVDVGGTIEKRLRVEHVKFFRNGGTYSGTQQVGIDLTTMVNVRNGKMWSYGTSEYSFEKAEMPERYEFGWMDEVTEPFRGNPIEVVSPFVEKGKIENVDVAQFTSDIDMMLLNPSAFSQDGFAVMTMDANGALPMVSYSTTIYGGYIQNGLLAFVQLHNPYWLYDMPAKSLMVNGVATQALGVSRNKSQTVSISYNVAEPNLQRLVRTAIGDGQIRQLSLKLTSRMAKVQLRYDTEL